MRTRIVILFEILTLFSACGEKPGETGSKERIRLASPLIHAENSVFENSTYISAELRFPGVNLYYSLDGTDPAISGIQYQEPFLIDKTAEIQVVARHPDWQDSRPARLKVYRSRLRAAVASLSVSPDAPYSGTGSKTLIDRTIGTSDFGNGEWLGFQGKDVELVIDLGKIDTLSSLIVHFLEDTPSWIFRPLACTVGISADSSAWEQLPRFESPEPGTEAPSGPDGINIDLRGIPARYIRLLVEGQGNCPDWHPGKGEKAWMFLDEIIME